MHLFKLIFRNIFRHKLRTGLTVLGIVVAILVVRIALHRRRRLVRGRECFFRRATDHA